jgi:hypothetical protein
MYDDILGPKEVIDNKIDETYIGFCMDIYDEKECDDCPSIEDCLKMNGKLRGDK